MNAFRSPSADALGSQFDGLQMPVCRSEVLHFGFRFAETPNFAPRVSDRLDTTGADEHFVDRRHRAWKRKFGNYFIVCSALMALFAASGRLKFWQH